ADVIGDGDAGVGQLRRVQVRREDHGDVQAFPHSRVELQVHHVEVLHREGVTQGSGHEEAAAGDGEDDVRPVAAVGDLGGELPGGDSVAGPVEGLSFHAGTVTPPQPTAAVPFRHGTRE